MTQENYKLMPVARSPEGVSTASPTHPLATYRTHDPFKLIRLEDDFIEQNLYTTTDTQGWYVSNLSGTQGTPVVGLTDALGGVVSVATSATANADSILRSQKKVFYPNSGTELWLHGRFAVGSLVPVFTFGFQGTSYNLRFVSTTTTGQLSLRVTTPTRTVTNFSLGSSAIIVVDTYFTVSLHYDFIRGKISVWFNEAPVLYLSISTDLLGSMPEELAYALFGIQNTAVAAGYTLLADYVLAAQSR